MFPIRDRRPTNVFYQELKTLSENVQEATILFVAVAQDLEGITLRMTNDGEPPKEKVTPRGGLADLRRMITEAGGKMEIQSQPAFVLTVTLPVCERGTEQEVPVCQIKSRH